MRGVRIGIRLKDATSSPVPTYSSKRQTRMYLILHARVNSLLLQSNEKRGLLGIPYGFRLGHFLFLVLLARTRGVSTHPTDVSVASVAYRIRR